MMLLISIYIYIYIYIYQCNIICRNDNAYVFNICHDFIFIYYINNNILLFRLKHVLYLLNNVYNYTLYYTFYLLILCVSLAFTLSTLFMLVLRYSEPLSSYTMMSSSMTHTCKGILVILLNNSGHLYLLVVASFAMSYRTCP